MAQKFEPYDKKLGTINMAKTCYNEHGPKHGTMNMAIKHGNMYKAQNLEP